MSVVEFLCKKISKNFYIILLSFLIIIATHLSYKMIVSKKPEISVLPDGDYQVVAIINKDLKMEKGKILSQFGHGIDALHEELRSRPSLENAWRRSGSAKIVVKGTQDDLNNIHFLARKIGIPFVRIYDAGRTQVRAGSNTVVVVGPATKEALKDVTGHLQLY